MGPEAGGGGGGSDGGGGRTAGVAVHPPVLYAGAIAAGALLDRLVPIEVLAGPGDWRPGIGIALIAAGFAILGWAAALFRRAGTNLPTNKPVEALVTSGPYRLSRNPIYVALTAAYLGVALWAASVWMLALLPAVIVIMIRGVITREEALLERLFGDDYRDYKARVRRWL